MKKKITTYFLYLLLPALLTGCLYEHPIMTEDGEIGVDPTSVILNAKLKLNLKMPAAEEGGTSLLRPTAGDAPQYRHRFIIDAYLDRVFVARQVVYQDIVDGRDEISLPVSMKLHARNYEIAVWTDYVQMPDEAEGITGTEDYFYNSTDNHLLTVYGSETYRGNNEYKDAFCGSAQLELEQYRGQWNTQVSLDMELARPVMRYELVANDVQKFLKLFTDGKLTGDSFIARVKYISYLKMGYNVLERIPRHGLMFLQQERTIKNSVLKDKDTYPLTFDYAFAAYDAVTRIPVTLEIVVNKKVVASTTFNITGQAGKNTTITYGFLTANPDGGIDFDPDFDGKEDIIVPVYPTE
ncbi:DUF6562 domain-containing protein [Bacteroides sp. AM10-21B]|uniref:DUF6562 domain-containing protein n=1 Tax=Bacteroides sp. AM10-21B TaxID=2292001 RepID=UPI000E5347D9|nr:DUF6562 domain-containing protein [Bacteroides sp. AM10-21B]RHJ52114.1 hypothetical protein DW121_06315 [Bacteroides sp. AM10-21B]